MIHAKKTLLKVLNEPMALSVMKSRGEVQIAGRILPIRRGVVRNEEAGGGRKAARKLGVEQPRRHEDFPLYVNVSDKEKEGDKVHAPYLWCLSTCIVSAKDAGRESSRPVSQTITRCSKRDR